MYLDYESFIDCLIKSGEVKHGVIREDYKYLDVWVGCYQDLVIYNFYHISAIAKLNFD